MKKLFTLLALLCMTAVGMAQVTFTCTAGKNFEQGEGIDKMFDGNTGTKYCGAAGDDTYALVTASEPVFVWGYDMTTANDNAENSGQGYRLVRRWSLYGTNDATIAANPYAGGWVALSAFGKNDFIQQQNFSKHRFFCDKSTVTTAYKYFKLVLNEGNGSIIQLSEFSFCYETKLPVIYDWYASDGGEDSKKAVDWLLGQKWEGQTALQGKYLTIKTSDGQPHAVKSYSFSTHDDGSWNNRAPKTWKVEGSNDNSTWTTIHEVIGGDPIENANYKTFDFTPDNTTDEFTYLRLTLTSMKGTGYQQLGEWHVVSAKDVDTSYYQDMINALKAKLTDYAALGTTDPWYVEYKNICDGLDALLASEDYGTLTAQLNAATTLGGYITNLINSTKAYAFNGTSCWGDGHYSQLVDGNDNTKWGGNGFPQYVIFRVKEAIQPYFYKLVTGGDTKTQTGRNWKDWEVYGANFASYANVTSNATGWVLLDQRADISEKYLPMENNYPATFNFNQGVSEPYYYFMVKVTAPHEGNQQQMSELYLCTQEEFETIRRPLVDEFTEIDENSVVETDLTDEKTRFLTLFAELKTTDDAVRLTEVYNEMKALYPALVSSKIFVEHDNLIAKVAGVYQLGTAADMTNFAKIVNSTLGKRILNAVVTADIDMAEATEFSPIGNSDNPYVGTFDGKGKTISNFTYNNAAVNNVGLFGYVKDATIKHVLLKASSVTGHANAGGLVGNADNSTIESNAVMNCSVTGYDHVASLVANAVGETIIRNNLSNSRVASTAFQAGGLVGTIKDATIEKNLFTGSVSNPTGTVCGLISMIDAAGCTISIKNNMVAATSVLGGYERTLIYPDNKEATYADNYILDETTYTNPTTVTNKDDENGKQVIRKECTAKSFYTATLGWDMVNDWKFTYAGQYPVLAWMQTEAVPVQAITVSAAGYATAVAAAEIDFTNAEVVAFTASVSNENFIHLEPITIVPAGMPIVVKAAAGSYEIPYAVEYGEDTNPANELKVSDTDITADGTQYILAKDEGVVGFYKAKAQSTIAAGKAYLVIGGTDAKLFYFEGETTGVNGVNTDAANAEANVIYNLAGQRLNKMQKGVNIVNGKKVIK